MCIYIYKMYIYIYMINVNASAAPRAPACISMITVTWWRLSDWQWMIESLPMETEE